MRPNNWKISQTCTAAPLLSTGRRRYGTNACLRNRPKRMRLSSRGPCGSRATGKRGNWLNKSRRHAVPLSKVQIEILRLLAANRDPESYVAGAAALNREAPRYSGDIDVFHGREERV